MIFRFYITPANETPFNNGIFHFSKNFAGQSFFQSRISTFLYFLNSCSVSLNNPNYYRWKIEPYITDWKYCYGCHTLRRSGVLVNFPLTVPCYYIIFLQMMIDSFGTLCSPKASWISFSNAMNLVENGVTEVRLWNASNSIFNFIIDD